MRVLWYNTYMKTNENQVENLTQTIEELKDEIEKLKQQNQWLLDQIRLSKHKQFGPSREQVVADQMSLFNEAEATAEPSAPEPTLAEVKSYFRKRTRLTTDKLPDNLPIEIINHKLAKEDCVCPECSSELHEMGKETRDELKIIPAKAVILRHVRQIYSCRNCENTSEHVPIC